MFQRIGELLGKLGDVVVGHRRELLAHDLLRGLDGRAVHRRRGVCHFPDAEHDEMRSTSGRGLQGSKRGLDDRPDHGLIQISRLFRRGGVTGIGAETGIHVHFEDCGLALRVEAEIDAGIAREREELPAGEREACELGGKLRVLGFQTEAARRADIGRAVRRPFGVIADDPGRAPRSRRTRSRRWAERPGQTVRREARG